MLRKLSLIFSFYVPRNLKDDPFVYRKALVLTYLHLFLLIIAAVLWAITNISGVNNIPHIGIGVSIGLILFYIYNRFGNLVVSGNLIALLWFCILAPTVPNTGGLHSDNLLWLVVSPLIPLLFANKLSGFIWLSIQLGFIYYLYVTTDEAALSALLLNTAKVYFLISYTSLFIVIFFVVVIFEFGQGLIIQLLHSQKELLEDQKAEIAEKNAALQRIEEKMKHTNAELENFAFAASHDLKEPLRMIGMYTQLLKRRMNTQIDPVNEEFMGYITDGVSRMQHLLDDLLQYSRLGRDHTDIKEVDINSILFVVIHNLMPVMNETKAEIITQDLPKIMASSTAMIQLFQNLIANAIKFRKKDSVPQISIKVKENTEGYLFSIKDNGIGIKKEYTNRVFNIFERLNTRQDYEGSGIGLATCKKIVENMSGRIWVRSIEGEGSTFYILFPKPKEGVTKQIIKSSAILEAKAFV